MRFRSTYASVFAVAVFSLAVAAEARPVAGKPTATAIATAPTAPTAPAAPIIPLTTLHPTSYDVRLRVEPDGTALVEHTLAIRVSGGPFKSLDLKASDPRSVASGEPSIHSEDGRPATASLTVRDNGVIHLQALEEKGWKRGAYTIRFALKTDLETTGALKRDGVMYRITWPSPVLGDGIDGMRVVFDLPAAPTEPRAGGISREGEENLLATLRRSAARDELEIVRPHVGRNEAVQWEVRVDPRALPAVRSPALAPRPLAPAPSAPAPTTPIALAIAAGAMVVALAFAKERALGKGRTSRRSPALVPAPSIVRLALAGAAAASALVAFVEDSALVGAALVATTCALVARRSSASRIVLAERKARGPGEWLALRPLEVFAQLPASFMGFGSWRGRVAFVVAVSAFALGVWGANLVDPRVPSTLALLGAVIPTLWTVDARSHLDRARALLARAHRRLARSRTLRAVPFVRVPKGGKGFEEVRLRVLPRHPMPGLLALEMGSAGEAIEILVRVRDDSPASRRLSHCAEIAGCRTVRAVPGRVAEERVLALDATSPTLAAACRLAADLSDALIDRREVARAPYEGPERRGFADETPGRAPHAARAGSVAASAAA